MSNQVRKDRLPRRHFTAQQKIELVQASYEPTQTVAEVARKYNVGVSTLIKWRKQSMSGSLMVTLRDVCTYNL